jgi:hypothetical protein
MERDRIG